MFVQRRKTGGNEGDGKEKEQILRRNLDRITCNNCGKKVIMMRTMISLLKPGSKKMQRLSEKLMRRNSPSNPLAEENRKH